MSEYQYFEWQTVDRLLTAAEQAQVERLSSHISVSVSQAWVEYHWSDFKHDPAEVLLKYFDAHLYWANWGSLRLMFRFPIGLLDETAIQPYLIPNIVEFTTHRAYQVLDLTFSPEDYDGWAEGGTELSHLIGLRAALIEGDTRLLYLAWLKAAALEDELYTNDDDTEEYDDDSLDRAANDLEPPVPPGLKALSPELQHFAKAVTLDPFLLQAAAEASPNLKQSPPVPYAELVSHLPRAECEAFLTRLAERDPGVGMALRKRLAEFLPPAERSQSGQQRSFPELSRRAQAIKSAEKKRQAEAALRKHIAEMKALAEREAQAWQQVDHLLDNERKIASVYDEATTQLEKLKQLSEFQNHPEIFSDRIKRLAQKYAKRPSLIQRWQQRGWI